MTTRSLDRSTSTYPVNEKEKVSEMLHVTVNANQEKNPETYFTEYRESCLVERHPQHQDRKESQKDDPR